MKLKNILVKKKYKKKPKKQNKKEIKIIKMKRKAKLKN